ncbi:MAG: DinB family protein [Vicinamibacterales bacterium]
MLDRAFGEFAAARGQTVRLASFLTQPQFDFPPRAGRWSIGEVVDHLLLAEDLYRGEIRRLVELARAGKRPYLRRSFSDVNVSPLFMPDMMLSMFEIPFSIVNRFMPQAVRNFATEYPFMPTRNPDVATPRPGRSAAALRDELVSSLEQTHSLLMANADLNFEGMISEHPLTGATNVPQILGFLARHERRHHSQIDRVKSDSRFPW